MSGKPTYAAVASNDQSSKGGKSDAPAEAPPPCKSTSCDNEGYKLTQQILVLLAHNPLLRKLWLSHMLVNNISRLDMVK
jgi:hypothetical protein